MHMAIWVYQVSYRICFCTHAEPKAKIKCLLESYVAPTSFFFYAHISDENGGTNLFIPGQVQVHVTDSLVQMCDNS